MITVDVPVKVDIRAKATSTFTEETVNARIVVLRSIIPVTQEALDEIRYLLTLKQKKGWSGPDQS
jgi:hypothetical protein